MAKNYYSSYIEHCMRFYARYPVPTTFRSDVDEKNWRACETFLKEFSAKEREYLLIVYREGDTLVDNVYKLSEFENIKQDKLWELIKTFERKIAKCRGLI